MHYPEAERIRTYSQPIEPFGGALYKTFPPDEERRVLRCLESDYAPKHASWLKMAEIEIGVLAGQCLDRRALVAC